MREHEEGGRESERENIDSDNTKYLLYKVPQNIDHIFTSLISLPSPLSLFLFHAPLSFPVGTACLLRDEGTIYFSFIISKYFPNFSQL